MKNRKDIGLWAKIRYWQKWKRYWASPNTKELEEMENNPVIMGAINQKFPA